MMEERGFGDAVLMVEPGRSIVGDAGLMLTQVEYIKLFLTQKLLLFDSSTARSCSDLVR